MEENAQNQNDTVILERDYYHKLLESHAKQSIEISDLQDILKNEYAFAESKIAEIKFMQEFIESAEDIKSRFDKYVKKPQTIKE